LFLWYRKKTGPGQRKSRGLNFSHTLSHIFIIDAGQLTRFARNWLTRLANQLLAGFIHAYHGIIRVIGQMIHFQHIFHYRYKGRTALWPDFPVLPEMRSIFVLFRTRCTVI
jgi:hypothetical protein